MDAQELQRIRTVPLEAVLEGFGAQRDPKDPKRNWRVGSSRITVTGDKFFDHSEERGGGGALDLTLYLMGHDPRRLTGKDLQEAARWLGATDRVAQVAAQRMSEKPLADVATSKPQAPPVPDESRLARVRWYLTERRGLPEALVASRAEGSIIDDLVTPADEAARMKAQRSVLTKMADVLDKVSPGIRRLLAEESGIDIDELLGEAKRVLG